MARDGIEANQETVSLLLKLHGKACHINKTPEFVQNMENFIDSVTKGGYKGHPKINMNESILRYICIHIYMYIYRYMCAHIYLCVFSIHIYMNICIYKDKYE
jgi:hypothetical protein